MSLATFKTCLDRVPLATEILFAGMAEPWLNPEATAMLLYAHQRGHRVGVYTTTSGMTVDDVKQLTGIDYLHFVIHLPDAGGRMKLKVTEQYLAVLRACMAAIPHHYSVIGQVHPEVAPSVNRPVNDDTPGLLSRAGNVGSIIPRKTGKIKCGACGPENDHNVLLPNGDVALCCMVYDLKHTLGNLVTDTYESLFSSPGFMTVRRGMDGDESVDLACRTCELAVPA